MSNPEPRPATLDPAPVFAALGDRTRLSLLSRLSTGNSLSIARLSAETAITRQAVTKHLQVLEGVGLLISVRRGRESLYTFRPEAMKSAQNYLDVVSTQWDDALGRFKSSVEADDPV